MDPSWSANGEEPPSWDELYNINLVPSEIFLKFRKEVEGFRLGVNLEFYNAPINDFHTKLVLKPMSPERRWKFIYEPIHQDVRILSKKIPIAKFLNLQVGIGHNFSLNATGWKWKLTTCLGGDGVSRIRNKTSVGVSEGVDLRFGWRADYVLPEITGGLGTDEPLFNMESGRLQASLDRVEAIFTHKNVCWLCDASPIKMAKLTVAEHGRIPGSIPHDIGGSYEDVQAEKSTEEVELRSIKGNSIQRF